MTISHKPRYLNSKRMFKGQKELPMSILVAVSCYWYVWTDILHFSIENEHILYINDCFALILKKYE
jgi:hypothetical protein